MIVIGHRGMRFIEPENTLRAIERALRCGVDAVEVDVRMTRDGRLVLMHDETVDRTTDGEGRVRDLTFNEIRRLDAGKGERVPTLEEVLEAVKGRARLVIEIKESDIVREVVEAVDSHGIWEEVVLISFHHPAVLQVKQLRPDAETGVIFVCEPMEPQELALRAKAEWMAPNLAYTTERLVMKAHENEVKVNTWVVNTREEVARAKNLGVDAVTTDRPDLITNMVKTGTLI